MSRNKHTYVTHSTADTIALGRSLAADLRGGDIVVLLSDVGGGKTTLTKGIASGLNIHEQVQSPTFTISAVYTADDGRELHHYDFYRLQDPGLMTMQLAESLERTDVITIIEWPDVVHGVLEGKNPLLVRIAVGEAESDRHIRVTREEEPKVS